jgi:hypothetical protein
MVSATDSDHSIAVGLVLMGLYDTQSSEPQMWYDRIFKQLLELASLASLYRCKYRDCYWHTCPVGQFSEPQTAEQPGLNNQPTSQLFTMVSYTDANNGTVVDIICPKNNLDNKRRNNLDTMQAELQGLDCGVFL